MFRGDEEKDYLGTKWWKVNVMTEVMETCWLANQDCPKKSVGKK